MNDMEVLLKEVIVILLLVTFSATAYDFVVQPEFVEKEEDLAVTAYIGQTSRLPCTVKHLSGKRVSWIRQRDLQVLSSGRHTFSTDLRISVLSGTRFQRRSLGLQEELSLRESEGTDGHLRGPGTVGWVLKPFTSQIPDSNLEDEGKTTVYILDNMSTGRRGLSLRSHSHTSLNDSRREKRQMRSVDGHYKYKRNKRDYGYKIDSHLLHVSSSSDRERQGSKKVLQFHSDQYSKIRPPAALPNASSGSDETGQTDAKDDNPISIYPQGPNSKASDLKTLKVSPNYIEGLWQPEDYTLQIKYTKPQDSGTYICQINTEPRITQAVVLRVVKMRAEIVGRRELFVKAGNPVKLSCRVNHGGLSPGFILWYKGERLVEYEKSGGRIQVHTETEGVSYLLLNDVRPEDSSNYTCSPAGGEPDSLILSVIVGERRAAMHQGNHCPSEKRPMPIIFFCAILAVGQLSFYPEEHPELISRHLVFAILVGINFSCLPGLANFTILLLLLVLFHFQNMPRARAGDILRAPVISSSSSISSGKASSASSLPKWDSRSRGRRLATPPERDAG
ncbi:uncharacterized protein LOC135196756 [Macrobrachium nipponense]|uniref:uncharacterized protein LOC135196756 n=1 Tax=Macrobrachium nipponense TaxID=159736 RepID=UPI0030C88228